MAARFKVKCRPEDFVVGERTDFPLTGGPFAAYRLHKTGVGTLEALAELSAAWRIPRGAFAVGGLKDRHAATIQHLTVLHGPRRDWSAGGLRVEYLDQAPRPFASADIAANAFTVTLRDLDPTDAPGLRNAAENLGVLPNYFDAQRFGSRGESGEFVAEPWCRGDHERALWLALAEPNAHDTASDREEKAKLRSGWGRWRDFGDDWRDCTRRKAVRWLAYRPGDFRGALPCLPAELRTLLVSAFQSWLWNQCLALAIRAELPADGLADALIERDPLPFPRFGLPDRWLDRAFVLPSARQPPEDEAAAARWSAVLAPRGLEPRLLRIKYPRDTFFGKGVRPTAFVAERLHATLAADSLFPGRSALRLSFTLPRGCYATILLKALEATG